MGGAFFCCWSHVEKKSVNTFFGSVFACTQKHFSMQVNFHNGKVLMKCCRKRKMFHQKTPTKLGYVFFFVNLIFFRLSNEFSFRTESTNFLRSSFVIGTYFPLNLRTLDCNIFRFRQHFSRTFPL